MNFIEDLAEILTELWNRVFQLEGEKFDLEREFRMKAYEVIVSQRNIRSYTLPRFLIPSPPIPKPTQNNTLIVF